MIKAMIKPAIDNFLKKNSTNTNIRLAELELYHNIMNSSNDEFCNINIFDSANGNLFIFELSLEEPMQICINIPCFERELENNNLINLIANCKNKCQYKSIALELLECIAPKTDEEKLYVELLG